MALVWSIKAAKGLRAGETRCSSGDLAGLIERLRSRDGMASPRGPTKRRARQECIRLDANSTKHQLSLKQAGRLLAAPPIDDTGLADKLLTSGLSTDLSDPYNTKAGRGARAVCPVCCGCEGVAHRNLDTVWDGLIIQE